MVAREQLESYLPEPKTWPNGEVFTYTIEDTPQYGTVLKLTVDNSPSPKAKGKPFQAITQLDLILERDFEFPERTLQQMMAVLEQSYDSEVNKEKYEKERQERRQKYRGKNKPPEGVDNDEQT